MMENITVKVLMVTLEKWNHKLILTVSITVFASMYRLCPKDIMEEIAHEKQDLLDMIVMALKIKL